MANPGETRWRRFVDEDKTALESIERRQTGSVSRIGDLLDPLKVCVLVAEREGEIVGAIVAQATVEVFAVGADAKLMRSACRNIDGIRSEFAVRGIADCYLWEPWEDAGRLEPILRRCGLRRIEGHAAFLGRTK